MKGDAKAIEHLNKLLTNELTAINQYFLHARMLQHWGLAGLGDKVFKESIDEMKHADDLAKRVLFLEGLPNFQRLGKLHIGENVKECLEADLQMEYDAIKDLKEASHYLESIRDYTSQELVESILHSEEAHVDWLETELRLFKSMGEQNYIQKNS